MTENKPLDNEYKMKTACLLQEISDHIDNQIRANYEGVEQFDAGMNILANLSGAMIKRCVDALGVDPIMTSTSYARQIQKVLEAMNVPKPN